VIDERSEVRAGNATPVTGTCDWRAEGEDGAEVTITGGKNK